MCIRARRPDPTRRIAAEVHDIPVSLAVLGDRDLDVLEASDLSPAWYPVVGALDRLWDVPKRKPSAIRNSQYVQTMTIHMHVDADMYTDAVHDRHVSGAIVLADV